MPRLFVGLLGSFTAELDGKPVIFAYGKTKAILAYLSVELGRSVRREKLAGLIWPDFPQEAAQEDLRQALSRLRKSLGDSDAFLPFLITNRESVRLNPQANVQVDIIQFQHALEFCAVHSHRHAQACPTCARYRNNAAQLYRGEFLEDINLPDSDLFEDWVSAFREQIHAQAVDTFRWLTDYYLRGGNSPGALAAARRGVDLEPFSEEACLRLLRILAHDGQAEQAVNHFRRFQKRFLKEMAQTPALYLEEFVQQLRSGVIPLGASGHAAQAQGLPIPLTPLVGRQVELLELDAWMSDPARRLITILGPGGIGKSRLVIAAANNHAIAFKDGVIFISFTSSHTRAGFIQRLAREVGISSDGGMEVEREIPTYFSIKDCLLILDGFENVADSIDILDQLLQSAPELVIVITSRERVNLPGEWVFPLGGLSCPAPGIVQDMEKYSAVELFIMQARHVDPDFMLTSENRETISQICRLVDGMPLAIDLASAWIQMMPCHEIAVELQHGLGLLSSSVAGDRHFGIRAAFEQSWVRLSPEEQRVFRQVTVFRGGFDRQAAHEVVGAAVEILAGLVNKSFVRGSAEGRYHVHDLLIQYGMEKLNQAAEFDEMHSRYCQYFLETAEKMETSWFLKRDVRSFFWLVKEQDNLHSALDWAVIHDPELAPRLSRCMHADLHKAGIHELRQDLHNFG